MNNDALNNLILLAQSENVLPNDAKAQSTSTNQRPWPVIVLTALGAWLVAIPAIIVIPVTFIMPYFENTLGRKGLLSFTLLFTGVILIASLGVPNGKYSDNGPVLVFAWIANVALNIAWSGAKVFTKDLFPTTHRTMAFGAASAAGRIGSLLAPYVIMLDVYDPILALLFYSFWVILGGLASIWIWPETKNLKFPDSLEECEKMSATQNSWLCCFH